MRVPLPLAQKAAALPARAGGARAGGHARPRAAARITPRGCTPQRACAGPDGSILAAREALERSGPTAAARTPEGTPSTSAARPQSRGRAPARSTTRSTGACRAEGLTLRHSGGRLDRDRPRDRRGARRGRGAAVRARLFDRDLGGAAARAPRGRDRDARAGPGGERAHARDTVRVLNGTQKTVVRLTVETHEGLAGASPPTAVRGYDRELERVDARSPTTCLPEATVPLVDEAVAAAGGRPAGTSAKLDLGSIPSSPRARPPRSSSPACSR